MGDDGGRAPPQTPPPHLKTLGRAPFVGDGVGTSNPTSQVCRYLLSPQLCRGRRGVGWGWGGFRYPHQVPLPPRRVGGG